MLRTEDNFIYYFYYFFFQGKIVGELAKESLLYVKVLYEKNSTFFIGKIIMILLN